VRDLEKRVTALQAFGPWLREAAERVAERARQQGDAYLMAQQEKHALLRVLGMEGHGPDHQT